PNRAAPAEGDGQSNLQPVTAARASKIPELAGIEGHPVHLDRIARREDVGTLGRRNVLWDRVRCVVLVELNIRHAHGAEAPERKASVGTKLFALNRRTVHRGTV